MLQVSRADVVQEPFPHVCKDEIIPGPLFARLKADFPNEDLFRDETERTGGVGSRVGASAGFDIYRGDRSYDELIARSQAWAVFDSYINSPSFVEKFLEVFGPDLDPLGCNVDVTPGAYQRELVEGRDALVHVKPGLSERIWAKLGAIVGAAESSVTAVDIVPRDVPLLSRLDIERSTGGYAKPPHTDHSNRLCSLILYFTDMDRAGIEGGELNIYAHKEKKAPSDHERSPRPSAVTVVDSLKPRENLGVFFPCSNNSYHGVNAIRSARQPRDFLYINLSAHGGRCWK